VGEAEEGELGSEITAAGALATTRGALRMGDAPPTMSSMPSPRPILGNRYYYATRNPGHVVERSRE
jgi:hypothetical protein